MTQLMRCFLTRPLRRISLPFHSLVGAALWIYAAQLVVAQEKPGVVDIVPDPQEQGVPTQRVPAAPAQAASSSVPTATKLSSAKSGDYSKEALVFDKLATRIREEADGTGTEQTTARIHILADAGVNQMAVLQFTYTAGNQQIDIAYVRVIKPGGTIVITPAYNVQDLPADVTRTAPMYSDIHQKHVAVKGLGVGDTLEYQVTLTTLKPEVPGHFWFEYTFQKDLVMLDEEVDLDLPADKAVTVASAAGDPQPAITAAASRKLYHWASSNLARPDPDAPPKSTRHWKPSIQVTTFASWEQVGAWYAGLQQDSLEVSPAVAAKAAVLTKGMTSDEDKVRAIFNDVALHIHYVGLEFGIGRYQPHPADDVLSNEYGDCKDKHSLLAAELKAAGIEAWPVLISAGRELDPATPSPAQFNHVITLVPLNGKLLWMDSTEEVAPVGSLVASLRDKQALAIPAGKPPYLERTPANLPFPQSARYEVAGNLSDKGEFTGRVTQAYHGDVELLLRTVLRQVPESQWKQAMQNMSQGAGFGGEISNPQISEIEQTGLPLHLSYDYTREKFGEWDDHRISPAMPPTGWASVPGIKQTKPADDVEIGSPGEQVYVSSITLPKGWSLNPEQGEDLKQDWAEYHSTYTFKDGVYRAERRILVKQNKAPLADWDKYLNFRRSIYADEVKTTYLIGGNNGFDSGSGVIGGAYTSAPPMLRYRGLPDELRDKITESIKPLQLAAPTLEADPPASADEVAAALGQCRQMMTDADATSAKLSDDDAHSLYWSQVLVSAWACMGWAELESKEEGTAEVYLRPAWKLTQSRTAGYLLALAMEQKGNKTEAAHLYELASITSVDLPFGGGLTFNGDLRRRMEEGYKRVTGRELTATSLNHGAYNGSLRAELDKELEMHALVRTTKLNGTGYFLLTLEAGKPAKAHLLTGDKGIASLLPDVQARASSNILPAGSKARLFREVRVICTEWAGCDGSIYLPTAVQIPMGAGKFDVSPPNAPAGSHIIQIKEQPK
jgi:hypothetical protein